jgi:hypothetical protein
MTSTIEISRDIFYKDYAIQKGIKMALLSHGIVTTVNNDATITLSGSISDVDLLKLEIKNVLEKKLYPEFWDHTLTGYNEVKITPDSLEYTKMSTMFKNNWLWWKTSTCAKIATITRIQNDTLINRGLERLRSIMEARDGKRYIDVSKVLLFHGTPDSHKLYHPQYTTAGFDINYAKNGFFNKGTYFSKYSSYSHNYTGSPYPVETADGKGHMRRKMIIAEVFPGVSFIENMTNAATKTSSYVIPAELLDGTLDSLLVYGNDNDMYVVYDNCRAYPLYVVEYELFDTNGNPEDYKAPAVFAKTLPLDSFITKVDGVSAIEPEVVKTKDEVILKINGATYSVKSNSNAVFNNSYKNPDLLVKCLKKINDKLKDAVLSTVCDYYHVTKLELLTKYASENFQKEEKMDNFEVCSCCLEPFIKKDIKFDTVRLIKCGHFFHVNCLKDYIKTKSSAFFPCPICKTIYGVQTGSQPDGVMKVTTINTSCSGYETYPTFRIEYKIFNHNLPNGKIIKGTERVAYLPKNEKGEKILMLLKTSFERRLTFSIGTSGTTHIDDSIVWSIHHKTNLTGGSKNHGYPDVSYLDRVEQELKDVGIY